MNLEQVVNLLGLTVSKGGDGSIEDPWGGCAYENRVQADITDADSADGLVHIQRFIDLRGDMPTRTLFSYDGNTFELNMPYSCSGLSYDSASTESLYASYGDSWNVKALDSYLRAGGYTSMNDVNYLYHASVHPSDFNNPNGGMNTTLMILKPDGYALFFPVLYIFEKGKR